MIILSPQTTGRHAAARTQTDIQADIQTDKKTLRQPDTPSQKDKQTADGKTSNKHHTAYGQATDQWINKQLPRQTNGQIDQQP